MRRHLLTVLLLVAVAAPAAAQRTVDWDNRFQFFSDNTEFFNPYREGATWIGGRLWTELVLGVAPHVEVHTGLTAVHLAGDADFAEVRPLISLRYVTATSTGVIGTLITEDRHGFLEPLQVLQRDILAPVEYGTQWIERRDRWGGEYYLNWRRLNTVTQREEFEMGLLLHADPLPWLRASAQGLWVHRGGQLYMAGETTANNMVMGLGLIAHDTAGFLGESSLEAWFLGSSPGWFDSLPPGIDAKGHGTLIRASVLPFGNFRFNGVLWWGKGFAAAEGDRNYSSIGRSDYYKEDRFYAEVGLNQVWRAANGVSFESQFRFNKIDDIDTDALSWSKWEYGYRLMAKVPFNIHLWTEKAPEQ
jgi:hypothetical protein